MLEVCMSLIADADKALAATTGPVAPEEVQS